MNRFQKAWMFTAVTALAVSQVSAQVVIPSTYVFPSSAADATQPGFIWRVSEVAAGEPNQLSWAESQLAGFKGINLADPSATGVATAAGIAGATPSDPITFSIPGVLNVSKASGTTKGNFTPDDQMPGIPGTTGSTDNIAAEVLTYLDLPAGTTKITVNSDDGFRLLIGGAAPGDIYGPSAVEVSKFDGGRGAADTVATISVAQAGLYAARILYENGGGDANIEFFTEVVTAGVTNNVLVNDTANHGIKAYRAVTGTAGGAYAKSLLPTPSDTGVSPTPTISSILVDGGTPLAANQITLKLDGTAVTPTITKSGNLTTVSYVSGQLPPESVHTAVLTFVDGGRTVPLTWSFTTAGYVNLDPALAVTPDTTKSGFIYNIFANSGGAVGDNDFRDNVEQGLNGLLTDSTSGAALPNLASLSAAGAASGPAPALPTPSSPASFTIPGVINLSAASGSSLGVFPGDLQAPGLPATDGMAGGVEAEVLTYVNLPAGLTTFGVGTPNIYGAYVGSWDYTKANKAGHNPAAGGVSYQFYVYATQPGYYPVRVTWFQNGEADAGLELYTVLANGKKVLVNDTANGGLASYRALATPAGPYVKYVNPTPAGRQFIFPSSNLLVRVIDGAAAVNDSTASLSIDGRTATMNKTRAGNVLELRFNPTTLFTPSESHTATLTYADSTGKSVTNQWSFINLKSLWLPAKTPALFDDFESYPEGTTFLPPVGQFLPNVPTNLPATIVGPIGTLGSTWYAYDFTYVEDQATHGPADLTDPNSNYYLSWVVVSLDTFKGVEGDVVNVLPNQFLNGQAVDTIASGNVFMAESDNRANNGPGVNNGQVQFAYSKDYDLTGITNPVISWASLYKQNQDSLGSIEYSIDKGSNWFPVIYYLDGGKIGSDPADIAVKFDGTADAVATFTRFNGDVPIWLDNKGVSRGHNYGDGIAAPITQALAPYIAPRVNDDKTEGKRIEAVRIPMAANQKSVRLRLGQLGTCSWYIGMDNLGFYDVPPFAPTASVPHISGITTSGGNVTVTWTGGGTLESSPVLTAPSWTSTGNSTGTYTEAISGTKFFRVRN